MAVIPVCIGSHTDLRLMIPGAIASIKFDSSVAISPSPSIGAASGFTIRPKIASPTSTCAILPVAFTVLPSKIFRPVPINTTPTLSFSKFSAIPIELSSNSRSSPDIT